MVRENKKKRYLTGYFYALIAASAILTAISVFGNASLINTDGYINLSSDCANLSNGTCIVNYNITRYSGATMDGILSSSDWLRFNTTQNITNSSDGNNYSTAIAFERSSNNVILQNARNGMSNISAFFTLQSSTGILTTNGVTYANATNCTSGQYSRYEQNGWNCYNDASGGSGTVTSITINSTTPGVVVQNPTVTNSGTVIIDIANATTTNNGLMNTSQVITLNSRGNVSNNNGSIGLIAFFFNGTTINGSQYLAFTNTPGMGVFNFSGNTGSTILTHGASGRIAGESSVMRVGATNRPLELSTGAASVTPGIIIDASQNVAIGITVSNSSGAWIKNAKLYVNGSANFSSNLSVMGNLTVFQNTTMLATLTVPGICLNGDCKTAWPSGGGYDDTGVRQNISDLQISNTSTNTRVDTLNTSIQNLLSTNSTVFSILTALSINDSSIKTRIDTINITVENLLTSNNSIYTRIDTLNATIQNLLTTNNTIFGLILALGQNDTNLNNSINAVNTRATTINNTLVIVQQNVTDLQTSNSSTNTRINNVNTSVVSLATNLTILSNTAITTFGIFEGGNNATMSNSSTFYIYEGSGISMNMTTGTPYPGLTISSTGTSSGGANTSVLHPVSAFALLEEEFTHITSTSAYSFLGAGAISSGTNGMLDGEIQHPGVMTISDSTTANGGYFVRTAANAFLLNETEEFTAVIRAPGTKGGTTAIISGFFDSGTTDNAIVDGCYMMYNLSQTNVNSIGGRCKTNSVITYTTSNYTATNNTWYTLKGTLGNFGKAFNFSVYNGTGTLLWSQNVTTNIPTNSVNLFRQTGAGILAYENTTNAATVIAHVDYFSMGMNRTLSRY